MFKGDNMNVYCIQAGRKGDIKIGKAKDPVARILNMQTGSSKELFLLQVIPCESERAAYKLESELHHTLRRSRTHGEWFRPDKGLALYLHYVASKEYTRAEEVLKGYHAELTKRATKARISRRNRNKWYHIEQASSK